MANTKPTNTNLFGSYEDDFDTAAAEYGPKTFTLRGHTFRCIPAMSLDLQQRITESRADGNSILRDLFKWVLLEDDHKAFFELVDDPDSPVGLVTLGKIQADLMAVYTGKVPEGKDGN